MRNPISLSMCVIMIISLFSLMWTSCVTLPPPEPVSVTSGFIKRFDKNHDGLVSRREYPGPESKFNQLDKNRDGFIDIAEAPNGPPPPRRR